jgi:hypothetical protein
MLRLRRQPLHTFDVGRTVGYCLVGQLVAYNDLEALIERIVYKPPVCPSTVHSQAYHPLLGQLTNHRKMAAVAVSEVRISPVRCRRPLPRTIAAHYRPCSLSNPQQR